ncbi:hypothetical protein Psta_4102 [Pirellula staleyi DSM 6068]|uniref:Uncharacterized protein n=1 Tax=Pirellula staleyi (strain ATCC 27377 / DSM 6068 / ICPB 4128) TaxID=530564 RepID=D2R319_PIRSD|nr:hypothetical protein Psta_4102 [Pirellula staleyi DSM 6068]
MDIVWLAAGVGFFLFALAAISLLSRLQVEE